MSDDLLPYYEQELTFIRQMGAVFASKYPKIASRLLLDAEKCEDPHVERLLQAFALLTARIQHKLDDELPEVTDALLGMLYPHYVAPLPSMSIAQFVLDPTQGRLTHGHTIPRDTMLYTPPVQDTQCRFRTCYPVTLWPLEIISALLTEPDTLSRHPHARAMLRLELRCQDGIAFHELGLDSLRLFLQGGNQAYTLYEWLMTNVCEVQLRPLGSVGSLTPLVLPPTCIRAVGFGPDEGLLPYTSRSFLGYRLLQEYFALPEKFLFLDIDSLARAVQARFRDGVALCFVLNRRLRFEPPLSAEMFALGCTPVVNLFQQRAEPIRVHHRQTAYPVIPDLRRQDATEVYAIESVVSTSPHLRDVIHVQPFYGLRHVAADDYPRVFWYASRHPSQRQVDAGTEVSLSLVDLDFQPKVPDVETLIVQTTCTNSDLPGRLPFGGNNAQAYFTLDGTAPLAHIRCLKKPTATLRPPLRRGAQWRLLSHLSLNYLSLCEGGHEALQEMLRLYDFANTAVVRQQIEGIVQVSSRQVVVRPESLPWNGFCRGLEVTLQFDEDAYIGSGVFLFASVLEQFLGLYTGLNAFVQLIATTRQRLARGEECLKQWPPRAGAQILL